MTTAELRDIFSKLADDFIASGHASPVLKDRFLAELDAMLGNPAIAVQVEQMTRDDVDAFFERFWQALA